VAKFNTLYATEKLHIKNKNNFNRYFFKKNVSRETFFFYIAIHLCNIFSDVSHETLLYHIQIFSYYSQLPMHYNHNKIKQQFL
jgi:hypothetical protein